jgi:hypothetical protein
MGDLIHCVADDPVTSSNARSLQRLDQDIRYIFAHDKPHCLSAAPIDSEKLLKHDRGRAFAMARVEDNSG